jgi:hypothetical protein
VETIEERAKRLGLASAAVEPISARAKRLGLPDSNAVDLASPDETPEPEAGYGERLATTILQGAQVLPGMKAVEAAAGAVGSHLPKALGGTGAPVSYRDAYEGLGEQTDKLGKGRKFLAQAAMSPMLAPVIAARGIKTLSTAKQAALLGGADQLLSGDPDATVAGTAGRTAAGALTGAALGKLGSSLTTGARSMFAPSTGEQALSRANELAKADQAAYGTALQQGKDYLKTFVTPTRVEAAFKTPGIKKYVDLVRKSPAFTGADDATILAEAYKQMTAQQGGIAQRARDIGYDAAADLENKGIQASKGELKTAADVMMPEFRPAVAQHAKLKAQGEVADVVDAGAGRIVRGTKVSLKNADRPSKSPEALAQFIKTLSPDDAKVARDALLGQVEQNSGIVRNTVTGKNNINILGPASRAAPFLRQLDEQAGQGPLMQALRAMALGTAGAPFR